MRHRRLLQALVISMLAGGFAAAGQAPHMMPPSAGPVTAGAAYPPVGAKWNIRVTESGIFHSTVENRDVTATSVSFNGRPGYGLTSNGTTRVLDPSTFNPIGIMQSGKAVVMDTPDEGLFSWPLWVGKSWDGRSSHADLLYGQVWPPAKFRARVVAIEDVTVPAGTFKAFRIEYQGGIGSSSTGGIRSGGGSPGFESHGTYWYAPGPELIVKSDVVRSGTNYRWGGRTTTELLSTPR